MGCGGSSLHPQGGVRVPTKPLLHWNFGTRRARLVVFPIRGRNWCFSRSIDLAASDSASTQIPSTLKDLWTKIPSSSSSKSDVLSRSTGRSNAEIVTDFISFKDRIDAFVSSYAFESTASSQEVTAYCSQ
ncbi:hypothetical protein SDJN02_24117, partial [Cucurbita argyrosperma subsp. argyrosperma]